MNLYSLAQPKKLEHSLTIIMPLAYGISFILFAAGLYLALISSPADYQQGDSVRIMYIHVPASWFALFIYGFMGLSSAAFLVFRIPIAAYMAQAAAPVGAVYAFISLATGSIWGKPMWGTWWVWDARLTSMLVLFFMYLGYMFLLESSDDKEKALRISSFLAVIGLVNLPIVKFSVDWWYTLHQPASVFKMEGPSIHGSMLKPLFCMASAYLSLFIALVCNRLKGILLSHKIRGLQAKLTWQGES